MVIRICSRRPSHAIYLSARLSKAFKEVRMDKFLHRHNLEKYRRQLAESKDQIQRQTLVKLLTEEEAKDRASSEENPARD